MIGEDFLKKLNKIKSYYQGVPEIDQERFGIFKDFLDFLTIEDIELLMFSYMQKHEGDPAYNLSNVKVIEDRHDFGVTQSYLQGLATLKEGMDVKLILKIKKGEPAHYSPNLGVHVIPIYMRCEKGELSVFILDQAAGVICETRDGFVNMVSMIEQYAKQFYGDQYRIIKSSMICLSDARNCPIYALSALHYFIKKGHEFFAAINPYLVPQDQKVYDRDNGKLFHLRADGLPAPLIKMINRRTLERVNAAYSHEWMPVKVQLTPAYAQNDKELLWRVYRDPVGKHPQKTLKRYLAAHGQERKTSSEQTYTHNTAADDGMKKARKKLLQSLRLTGIIGSTDEKLPVDQKCLEKVFRRIRY